MFDTSIRAGESLRIDSTVTNLDGTPRALTSATGTFKVYDAPRGTLKLNGSFALNNATLGTTIATLDDSQTDLYAGEYHVFYYEVKLTENDGTETVIEYGKLVIQ